MSTALLPIERIQEIWTTALQRHGRATARPVVSHLHEDRAPDPDDPEIAVGVAHAGWRLSPRPDGTRSGSWVRVDRRLPAYALEATATECAMNAAERTKAQPGDAPATWEGSVLPALRLALDEHPETRGARIALRGMTETNEFDVEVHPSGRTGLADTINPATLEGVMVDVRNMAAALAKMTQSAKVSAPECVVCQSIVGWAPACEKHRPNPSGAPGGSATYDPAKVRATFDGQPVAFSAEPKGPDGYRFTWRGEHLQVDHSRCSARISWGNQSPGWLTDPEHREAWDHARRLLAERKQAPPAGYRFEMCSSGGGVLVYLPNGQRNPDNGGTMIGYWDAASHMRWNLGDNADPVRWEGHEPARQWAALRLGQHAPPLRGSEQAAPQVGIGSQVVLQARQDSASRGYDGLSATVTRRLNDQYVAVRIGTGEEIGWGVANLRPA